MTSPTKEQLFRVDRIIGTTKRVAELEHMLWFIGHVMEGETYDSFIDNVYDALIGHIDTTRSLIDESLRDLLGIRLTASSLFSSIWRLLGNARRLELGFPAHPWSHQHEEEWVPFQVLQSEYDWDGFGRPGCRAILRATAGTPCTMRIEKWWPQRFVNVLVRWLGFTHAHGRRPYRDNRELANLRLYGLVTPRLSKNSPNFWEVFISDADLKWNKETLKYRRRDGKSYSCPKDYPLEHACFQCWVGLDNCCAATHQLSYFLDICRECGEESWHDPWRPISYCLNCDYQFRRLRDG